ncbi:MAG: acyltransferase [Pseudobutyrivibrio sp.]|nr:acyltransferase [Pseudobutyrivibrio sp.]
MNKRIIGLDILRDIGVIFIFCYHFTVEYIFTALGTDPAMQTLNYFFNILARPASLFLFVISGYALMYNYEDTLSVGKFYLRRFKGLFIPFYVAYTLMFLASFAVNNVCVGNMVPLSRFIYTILGIDGVMYLVNSNFYLVGEWFMSGIVVCYLLFPLLARLMKKFKYIVLAVLLIWYVIFLFFFNPFGFSQLMNPLLVMVYFYMGMLLYDLLKDRKILPSVKWGCGIFSILVWIYFLLAGYAPQIMPLKPSVEGGEILNIIWSLAMIIALRDVEIAPEKRIYKMITYVSGISWYVILLHHRIMILLYTHYSVELYSRRETFTMFLLTVALTWVASIAVRKLSAKLKMAIS